MDNMKYQVREIPYEECRAIRRTFSEDEDLIEDPWDWHAKHLVLKSGELNIATYRIVFPFQNRLPVNDYFSRLPVNLFDCQIGRLMSARNRWTVDAAVHFYKYYVEIIRSCKGRIYVSTAAWGPISIRRYESLGFVQTGKTYEDKRYNKRLHILVRSP